MPMTIIHQGASDARGYLVAIVILYGSLAVTTPFKLRFQCIDADGASGSVAAKQGALGAAQNFYRSDIEQVAGGQARAAAVHVIHEDPDRGLQPGVVARSAYAADPDFGAGSFRGAGGDDQAGGNPGQVLHVADTPGLQLVAGKRGNSQWNLAYGLGAAGGGHHHLLQNSKLIRRQ